MKKFLVTILATTLVLSACSEKPEGSVSSEHNRNTTGESLTLQEVNELTQEQLNEILRNLSVDFSARNRFDVFGFVTPDEFGLPLGDEVTWEAWLSLPNSANSVGEAKQEIINSVTDAKRTDAVIEFIDENEYYYTFRMVYEQTIVACFTESGCSYSDYMHANRFVVFKNSAVDMTNSRISANMLHAGSIRDLLDLHTFFYANQGRHWQTPKIIFRELTEVDGGFIYVYYYVEHGTENDLDTAQLGKFEIFIDAQTGDFVSLTENYHSWANEDWYEGWGSYIT
ncbi:MAG: hypothetical protein FWD35_05730 [Oscillospiraceae bacterium]|nr:hypothetical protein [Oscillospiraceae bacterium]